MYVHENLLQHYIKAKVVVRTNGCNLFGQMYMWTFVQMYSKVQFKKVQFMTKAWIILLWAFLLWSQLLCWIQNLFISSIKLVVLYFFI